MTRLWTMSPECTGIGGKKKQRARYDNKVFLFAILLTLIFVALTFILLLSGAGENAIMMLVLFGSIGAIAACLIFVRANMSFFIAFFQADGKMFRIMACNTDVPPQKYIKGAVEKADLKAHKPYVLELVKFVGRNQYQVMQITGIESITERHNAYDLRCEILYRGKLRRKKLRIIKNYDDMDALITELEMLKGRSEQPAVQDEAVRKNMTL